VSSKAASGSRLLTLGHYGCSIAGVAMSVDSGQVLASRGVQHTGFQVSTLFVNFVFSGEVTRSAWTLLACGYICMDT
jgi:hypothetical protein